MSGIRKYSIVRGHYSNSSRCPRYDLNTSHGSSTLLIMFSINLTHIITEYVCEYHNNIHFIHVNNKTYGSTVVPMWLVALGSCRFRRFHSSFQPISQWVARPSSGVLDSRRLSSFHCSRRSSDSGSCLLRLIDDVLRSRATCLLLLRWWFRCTATRKLVQQDDLSSSTLGIGHLVWNINWIMIQHWSGVVRNQNGIRRISILWHYHDDGVHRELS